MAIEPGTKWTEVVLPGGGDGISEAEAQALIDASLVGYATETYVDTAIQTAIDGPIDALISDKPSLAQVAADGFIKIADVGSAGYALTSAVSAGDAATLATVTGYNYSKTLPMDVTAVAKTVTNAYSGVVYTGAVGANITIPAASTWKCSQFTVRSQGTGTITLIRGGGDLFDSGGASISVVGGATMILGYAGTTIYRLK